MLRPRIVTLTLNPALDLASRAETVRPTHKIRTFGEHVDPGGGGINVARVVHALGGEVTAILPAGGPTGLFVAELLTEAGVPHQVVPIGGRTRISLTVIEQASGLEYRFVPEGPELTEAEWRTVLDLLETVEGDWLVASGSLPRGVPTDIYARVARIAARRGQRFVLDTSGAALTAALGCGIELLKPSLGELEALLGRRLTDAASQEAEASALVRDGAARMVALTLGRDGAVLATRDTVLRLRAAAVTVESAVGAGDAFLGAMTLALARGETPAQALAWGIAGGTAAIGGIGTARITRAEVEARYRALGGEALETGNGARA
jgi:6-phosphofructokinase 2